MMTKKQQILMDAMNEKYERAVKQHKDLVKGYVDELVSFKVYRQGSLELEERIRTLKEVNSLILASL